MKRIFVLLVAAFVMSSAAAIDTDKRFDDPELQARYEQLISEVRCLQCQNQSIKDSNVSLAADLRREIARMIEEGKSDDEIADFLVVRYGEFALYRPRTTGKTLVLWIAPFLLVLLGVFALARVV
ncbi:MAG TPA: cytochrome c-type biogenesis protein, partial [Woeseiaceae bacterium]|nr:cytochrome c-type biogenesis protein [Woeseiaceae bacterium]